MLKAHKTTAAESAMLEHFAAVNRATRASRKIAAPPSVGIFFVYEGRPLIDSTPVAEAQDYGKFREHGRGHEAFWTLLQVNEIVPRTVEYDEVPRGRVGYDIPTKKFHIFADKCILKNQRLMDRIESDLNLPSANTVPPRLDSHYKCPGCTKKTPAQIKQEEEDWDF